MRAYRPGDLVDMGKARLADMQEHPHPYSVPSQPARWARAVVVAAMLLVAAAVGALLASCAAPETRVETRTSTNIVSVPTSVACFNAEDLPALPERTIVDATTATTDQLAAAAAADRENFMRYAKTVNSLWAQCSKATSRVTK